MIKLCHLILFSHNAIAYLLPKNTWVDEVSSVYYRTHKVIVHYATTRWKVICLCWHHMGIYVQTSYLQCSSVKMTFASALECWNHVVLQRSRQTDVLQLWESGEGWNAYSITVWLLEFKHYWTILSLYWLPLCSNYGAALLQERRHSAWLSCRVETLRVETLTTCIDSHHCLIHALRWKGLRASSDSTHLL